MKRDLEFHLSPMCHKIAEGAIFISDAHESQRYSEFYTFLSMVDNGEIQTTQLFLMGDMFDLLVGKVEHTLLQHKKHIELLEKIAQKIEVYYFEGNHDFSLSKTFLHVKVIPLQNQPLVFIGEDGKNYLLSHGDKFGGFGNSLYTKVIRNPYLLSFLNFVDKLLAFKISTTIEKKLLQKNICRKIAHFEKMIEQKIKRFYPQEVEYILEGHYHQNQQFDIEKQRYINFSSFACNQSYFIVSFKHGANFAQKKLRGCNV